MAEQLIRFGNYSLLYEDGFIRYISIGKFEIIRKIYFALRDSNWVTAEIKISDHQIETNSDGFAISYTATNHVSGKDIFRWKVVINGSSSGQIEFSIDGTALTEYTRNRAGLCILHPIAETLGKAVVVTKPGGSQYDSRFREQIDPHQPFLDIKRFRWNLEGDAWAELDYEGDTFETEDQRNWSDTSYKTYSTPLSIPYPVKLKRGDRVTQKVTLSLVNVESMHTKILSDEIAVVVSEDDRSVFPLIGSDFSGSVASAPDDLNKLGELRLSHLRIELDLSKSDWFSKLTAGIGEADAISADVFLHLIFGAAFENQWKAFRKIITNDVGDKVKLLAISPSDKKGDVNRLLEHVLSSARQLFQQSRIGAGFVSYFTELNRNRFDYSGLDFIIYSVNPQVHANDTNTIIENLPAQWYAVQSAGVVSNGTPVHVGPVSLRPRFNADAKPGTEGVAEGLPYKYDQRQTSEMAAGWMLASIKYLSEAGVEEITMMELHGMAGFAIVGNDSVHKDFRVANKTFPVFEALRALKELAPKKIIRSTTDQPRLVTSLALECESSRHVIAINHTGSEININLNGTVVGLEAYESKFIKV
jgi:D-apionolactonase